MNQNKFVVAAYVKSFEDFIRNLNGQNDAVIGKIRRQAISTISAKGFPTQKNEDWRYTDLKPLLEHEFIPVQQKKQQAVIDHSVLQKYIFPDWPGKQLVFVNGIFKAQFDGSKANYGRDVQVHSIAELLKKSPQKLQKYLDRKKDAFSALNTAFLQDGVFIELAAAAKKQELHLIFLSQAEQQPVISHPRIIIAAGAQARADIIESHFDLDEGLSFSNTLTDVYLEKGSRIDHVKIQSKNENSFLISNLFVKQSSDSRFQSLTADVGCAMVRNTVYSRLAGQGSHCELKGLYLGHGGQKIDNFTTIEHGRPHCSSNELYQGILTDKAHGAFSGMILVQPDAQKTEAMQSNNCLLLSEEAHVDSKPQLEIYADDVKCTHGATVGQLDEEQIFYLQSRGIEKQQAKNILTYAFAGKVIEGIEMEAVREKIDHLIAGRFDEDMKFILE